MSPSISLPLLTLNKEHPITPPPELVYRLQDLGNLDAIELAYQAGADQELEACCEWFIVEGWHPEHPAKLRAARRPKSSLKERAMQAMDRVDVIWATDEFGKETMDDINAIRRALESLPD